MNDLELTHKKTVLKNFKDNDTFEKVYSDTSIYDNSVIYLVGKRYITEEVLSSNHTSTYTRKKHRLTITPLGRDYLNFIML